MSPVTIAGAHFRPKNAAQKIFQVKIFQPQNIPRLAFPESVRAVVGSICRRPAANSQIMAFPYTSNPDRPGLQFSCTIRTQKRATPTGGTGRYGTVWDGMGQCGRVWEVREGMGRYGRVWDGMGGFGSVRGRYGMVRNRISQKIPKPTRGVN